MTLMIFGIIVAIGYMIGYRIWFRHETKKKLDSHQIQWEIIKRQLPPDANVFDEYIKFCDYLKHVHGNEATGACFPKM